MNWNWQRPDWPRFRFDLRGLEAELLSFARRAGELQGTLQMLPENAREEVMVDIMIAEAVQSSAIEGEFLDRQDVMSSIRNHLGLNPVPARIRDRASGGAGQLEVAARKSWRRPLTAATLFSWHRMLLAGTRGIIVGAWRRDSAPMQVVSGRADRPVVHFEAPPSRRVPREMKAFIAWFNGVAREIPHAPVRAAVAHLYFESVHPFDDGNGRIGRAVAEKALAQALGHPALFSLSRGIEAEKKSYYRALETAQKSAEITAWIGWFIQLALKAQEAARRDIDFILAKSQFFDRWKSRLNERQLRMLRRMLEAGPAGFAGGMNARKYIALTKVSKATATRDLQFLAEAGVLRPVGKGRSARYDLIMPERKAATALLKLLQ
jgi:Fic family protein